MSTNGKLYLPRAEFCPVACMCPEGVVAWAVVLVLAAADSHPAADNKMPC